MLWSVRAASRRALWLSLTVALLLHAPLLPTPLLAWLDAALSLQGAELSDYDAGETIIPVDLDILANEPSAVEQTPPPTGEAAPAPPPAQVATAAGPGSASTEAPDAGAVPDAGRARPSDAGPGDAGPSEDTGQPKLRDPLSMAGAPGKLASKDPNVQVLIAGDRLRKHELGEWFGRILTTIPQWQSFFNETSIDPIRDFDHLLIAGPQFRDSGKVVAILDYRAPEEAVRGAIDVVVQRSRGAWIEGAPVPAARARADRGERIFAMVPEKRLVVVLPPDQEDQLAKLKAMKPFSRSSSAGIVLSMVTPARALRGLHPLPTSLAWLRLALTPTKDGGADLALTLGDASPEEAQTHAQELTQSVGAQLAPVKMLMFREPLDEVIFNADGKVIWSKLHLTRRQLMLIMGFAEQLLQGQVEAGRLRSP